MNVEVWFFFVADSFFYLSVINSGGVLEKADFSKLFFNKNKNCDKDMKLPFGG